MGSSDVWATEKRSPGSYLQLVSLQDSKIFDVLFFSLKLLVTKYAPYIFYLMSPYTKNLFFVLVQIFMVSFFCVHNYDKNSYKWYAMLIKLLSKFLA